MRQTNPFCLGEGTITRYKETSVGQEDRQTAVGDFEQKTRTRAKRRKGTRNYPADLPSSQAPPHHAWREVKNSTDRCQSQVEDKTRHEQPSPVTSTLLLLESYTSMKYINNLRTFTNDTSRSGTPQRLHGKQTPTAQPETRMPHRTIIRQDKTRHDKTSRPGEKRSTVR